MTEHAILKLYIDPKYSYLYDTYKSHIENHNRAIATDPYPNSGFDIFIPDQIEIPAKIDACFINAGIKCEMQYRGAPSAFYLYPRSSFSKTPLMMANHVGIIDSGYRGNLISAVRNLSEESYRIEPNVRLFQICHPSLCPIHVEIMNESEMTETKRGEGGFGSTGIVSSLIV